MTTYEVIKTWGIDQATLGTYATKHAAEKAYNGFKQAYYKRCGEIKWTLRLIKVTRKELHVAASHEPAVLQAPGLPLDTPQENVRTAIARLPYKD